MRKPIVKYIILIVISCISLLTSAQKQKTEEEIARYIIDSCNICLEDRYTQGKELFELGELFTAHEIPYLNDHSIIYNPDDKKWHLYGIQNPSSAFIHLTADSLNQRGWNREKDFATDGSAIWAPHIIFHEGVYHMFYTQIGVPRELHHVISLDLYNWTKSETPILAQKNESSENLKNKDPMVFRDEEQQQWIMYYSAMKDDKHWVVGYSTSKDLRDWTEMKICFDEHTESPAVESPFVIKRGKYYYLFLSARPWEIGGEDIFKSTTPYKWDAKDHVQRVNPWHAAELVKDLNGQWYMTLSTGRQCRNFRMAPLYWNDNK